MLAQRFGSTRNFVPFRHNGRCGLPFCRHYLRKPQLLMSGGLFHSSSRLDKNKQQRNCKGGGTANGQYVEICFSGGWPITNVRLSLHGL